MRIYIYTRSELEAILLDSGNYSSSDTYSMTTNEMLELVNDQTEVAFYKEIQYA